MTLRQLMVLVLFVSMAIPAARADTLMVFHVKSGMAGAADGEATTVNLWSSADRIVRMQDNTRMIGHLTSGASYMVDDKRKTCMEFPPQQDVGTQAAAKVDVRKTGKTRQIGSWQAKGYELTVATDDDPIEVAVWISEDLAADVGGERAFAKRMLTADTAWLMTLFELGGYPVRQEVSMDPIKMISELVSVEEKSAPAGIYEVPAGYTGCE